MRSTFVKTTAAGLAILAGTAAVAAVPGVAFAQDNGTTTAPKTTQDAHGRREAFRHKIAKAVIKDAAGVIGIKPAELVKDLRSGQTLTQIAQAHNVDPATVASKLVADGDARIDKAVSENKISQAKGDELKAKLPARVDKLMNRTFDGHRGDQDAKPAGN